MLRIESAIPSRSPSIKNARRRSDCLMPGFEGETPTTRARSPRAASPRHECVKNFHERCGHASSNVIGSYMLKC